MKAKRKLTQAVTAHRKVLALRIPRLEERLLVYALVGAGVGTFSPSAAADVVYTPADMRLEGCFTDYSIDLNHDGVTDFVIHIGGFSSSSDFFSSMLVRGGSGTAVIGNVRGGGKPVAAALHAGTQIGPNSPASFVDAEGEPLMEEIQCEYPFTVCPGYRGLWVDVDRKYLGLKFTFNGETHYGWARLTTWERGLHNSCHHSVGRLTGYAYETQPDTTILAGDTGASSVGALDTHTLDHLDFEEQPQTGSLGMLSLGSKGLDGWRNAH